MNTTQATTSGLYHMVMGGAREHNTNTMRDRLVAQDPVKAYTMGMVYEDSPTETFDGALAVKARQALYALPSEQREEIQDEARAKIKAASGAIHNVEKHHKYLDLPMQSLERALYAGIDNEKFVTREGACGICTDLMTVVDSLKVLDVLYLDEEKTMDLRWKTLGNVLEEFVYT